LVERQHFAPMGRAIKMVHAVNDDLRSCGHDVASVPNPCDLSSFVRWLSPGLVL
jgi:hypothetical protein